MPIPGHVGNPKRKPVSASNQRLDVRNGAKSIDSMNELGERIDIHVVISISLQQPRRITLDKANEVAMTAGELEGYWRR